MPLPAPVTRATFKSFMSILRFYSRAARSPVFGRLDKLVGRTQEALSGSPQEFVKHSLLLGFLRSGIVGGRVAIEAIVTRHQCSGPSKEFTLSQRSTGI